jgi:cyanate permease
MRTTPYRLLAPVLPLALIQIVAWGTVYFSFPLFLDAIRSDLGCSRNQIAAGMTLGLTVAALIQLGSGRLIERWGPTTVIGAGCMLGATAMSWLSITDSLAGYYLGWAVLGATMALAFFEPAFAALLKQAPGQFELAVALLVMLSGLAGAVFLPITHWLIDGYGWRSAMRVFAFCLCVAGALALTLSLCWRETRRQPPRDGPGLDAPRGSAAADPKEPRFWALALGFALNSCVVTALVIHLFGLLIERGVANRAALYVTAAIGPAQILGRLAHMLLARRLGHCEAAYAAFAALLAGLFALQFCRSDAALLWCAVLCVGAGSGMITTLRGTLIAALFRPELYARAAGMVATPGSLLRAAAPLGASAVVSGMAGYAALGWIMVGLAAISLTLMVYSLRAYRHDRN